jgi:hypothetical protein
LSGDVICPSFLASARDAAAEIDGNDLSVVLAVLGNELAQIVVLLGRELPARSPLAGFKHLDILSNLSQYA